MTWMHQRDLQALQAAAEHRRREDEAARLYEQVYRLKSLRLRFGDFRPEGRQAAQPYIKLVVIPTAPALFEIRCMEPRCDGRHDLTYEVMQALRQAKTSFSGESPCRGNVGVLECDHVLSYEGAATYTD